MAALGEKMREMAANIYRNEVFFYTNYINICRNLEEEHGIPQEHKLRTAAYYGSSAKQFYEILVLEDLTANGFQNFDRFKSVTWDQTAESLEQLAKFHALSLAISIQKPEEFMRVKKSFALAVTEEFSQSYIKSISPRVIDATEDKNKDRLARFFENSLNNENYFRYFCRPIRKEVIVHGDYRPNNLMYKIENGRCQVVPLDHQTLHLGSPTLDLLYFIIYGFDDEFNKKYYQTAIDHYYTALCAALQRLQINPNEAYSREDFEYELKENRSRKANPRHSLLNVRKNSNSSSDDDEIKYKILPIVVTFSLCGLLIVTVNEDDAPSEIEKLGVEDFAFAPNDIYRKRLQDFIDFYTEIGVIP